MNVPKQFLNLGKNRKCVQSEHYVHFGWKSGLKYKGLAKLTNWKKYDGDSVDLCGEVDIDGGEKKGEGVSSKKES